MFHNLQIDKNWTAKIADFDIAKVNNEVSKNTMHVGTSYYIAPEVVLGFNYNEKCDVFSFAMIMVEIATNKMLHFEPYVEVKMANNPTLRPKIPEAILEANQMWWFADLAAKCWEHDPQQRPSFTEIEDALLEHMNQ